MNWNIVRAYIILTLLSLGLSGCSLDIQLVKHLQSQIEDQTLMKAYGTTSCVKKADGAPICFGGGRELQALSYAYPLKNEEILELESGYNHTCAVTVTGRAFCWGGNTAGALGADFVGTSVTPVEVKKVGALAGKRITDIALGYDFTCALESEGGLFCWGKGSPNGQLGNGLNQNFSVPVSVDQTGVMAGKRIVSVSGHGGHHMCALDDEGAAYCWGRNDKGQLGNNDIVDALTPVAVDMSGALAGKTILKIVTGQNHTCALGSDKRVYCWGDNDAGGLGVNISTATLPYSATPMAVYAGSGGVLENKNIAALAAGYRITCVLTEDGIPSCWGSDASGQIGNGGTNANARAPTALKIDGALAGKTITGIYAGFYHGCVLTDEGAPYCWGTNHFGYLGDGGTTEQGEAVETVLTNLQDGNGFSSLALENYQTCGLSLDKQVYCWGQSTLGNGLSVSIPTAFEWDNSDFADEELKYVRSMSPSSTHACYISWSYRVFCVGTNNSGQLGNGSSITANVPTAVDSLGALNGKRIVDVLTAPSVTYALSDEGDLFGWGSNSNKRLADPIITSSAVALAINVNNEKVKQIVSSSSHACALTRDGEVYCWGDNTLGQLGVGIAGASNSVPMRAEGLLLNKKVTRLISSESYQPHICALVENGRAYCWGNASSGQLGHGVAESYTATPSEVLWISELQGHRFVSMALSSSSTCALTEQGKAYCWGANNNGQLGVSPTLLPNSMEPVAVETEKTFTQIVAGSNHFCAQDRDQKIYCWGGNNQRQLGDLSFTDPFSEVLRLVNGL